MIEDNDHIVRYCKPSTLNYDNTEPSPDSFFIRLHKDEEYISVDWLEFYNEEVTEAKRVSNCIVALENRDYKPSPTGLLAVLKINKIKKEVINRHQTELSIYRTDNVTSHTAVSFNNYKDKFFMEKVATTLYDCVLSKYNVKQLREEYLTVED
ncbi:MAG: hypothetical protein ACP5FK_11575 [bacterium]